MARMPGAVWKPLPRPSTTKMARYDLVVIHTTVGSLTGTYNYFAGLTNGVNSHFLTGGYGETWQMVDTAVRSGANGAGNHRAITVENADMGPGFAAWNTASAANVPAFTAQQIEANAQICAWAHRTHGVPLIAADTSRPSARGVGYHRLGCDPYRVPDGEKWSSSYGKVCPGTRRIAQIPQIIARAREIVNQGDDDMPLTDADINRIREAVWKMTPPDMEGPWPIHRLEGIDAKTGITEHLARNASANAEFAAYALDGKLPPSADPKRIVPTVEVLNGRTPVKATVDGGLAAAAGPALVTDEQLARVLALPEVAEALARPFARAFADEQDRRARDGDPSTGPVS